MMSKNFAITAKSGICKIENGFLLTYVVIPYDHTVDLDSLEQKTEYYKTGIEATERLSKILLKELAQEIDFTGVNL